jgi:hypothetical protein
MSNKTILTPTVIIIALLFGTALGTAFAKIPELYKVNMGKQITIPLSGG